MREERMNGIDPWMCTAADALHRRGAGLPRCGDPKVRMGCGSVKPPLLSTAAHLHQGTET